MKILESIQHIYVNFPYWGSSPRSIQANRSIVAPLRNVVGPFWGEVPE